MLIWFLSEQIAGRTIVRRSCLPFAQSYTRRERPNSAVPRNPVPIRISINFNRSPAPKGNSATCFIEKTFSLWKKYTYIIFSNGCLKNLIYSRSFVNKTLFYLIKTTIIGQSLKQKD